jgi:sulfite reductase (NADPH) flavoprotein alpha-component
MKRDVKTLCPYCGVGCGIIATTDGSRMLSVRGDPDHPSSLGKLCQKGASVALTVHSSTRLHNAMIRDELGKLAIVSPDVAIQRTSRGLEKILQTHGPGAIAFYLSGQLTTESQYLAAKFAKACLRTNHVDSNSRLCMASAASGMSLSLGSDGPPTCYGDIEHADTFLFVGSNAAECHPIIFDRVAKQVKNRKARCIVIDPRRTVTADIADIHLAVRPGTDLVLINGLLGHMRGAGKLDREFIAAHTEGWEELDALLDGRPKPQHGWGFRPQITLGSEVGYTSCSQHDWVNPPKMCIRAGSFHVTCSSPPPLAPSSCWGESRFPNARSERRWPSRSNQM